MQVTIRTGARLHFGFFSVRHRNDVRRFGGIGVMLDSPLVDLTVTRIDSVADTIDGPVRVATRIQRFADSYRRASGLNVHAHFAVRSAIPEHKGLGSGTQLGLAVGRALSQLSGIAEPIQRTAERVGRGHRSAIGVHAFSTGGLIIDGGKRGSEIGELLSRSDFPEDWRFLLAWPRTVEGLSGAAERHAFRDLPEMSDGVTERLEHLANQDILPAIRRRDFATSSAGLHEFGMLNGEYFAPIQHGVYADPRMAQLAEFIRRCGFEGVGQSSWGPAIWVLCNGKDSARSLRDELQHEARWLDCEFQITAPTNRCAWIQVDPAAGSSIV